MTSHPIAPNRYMAMESGERYSELLRQDEEIGRLRVALQDIKNMTDVDNPESYRSDDHEGCLDAVYETAFEALREDKEIGRLAVENARLARELGTERSGHLLTVGERNWCSKEVDQLREALDMLYDRWENGDPCDEGGGDGRVVEISYEEEKTILALFKDFKTPQGEPALTPQELPSTREPVVTAPQGNTGESPALNPKLLASHRREIERAIQEALHPKGMQAYSATSP